MTMVFSNTSHPFTAVAISTLLVGSLIYASFGRWKLRQSRQEFKRINKCLPPRSLYPIREPFIGLNMILSVLGAARKKLLLHWFFQQYQTYGPTFVVRTIEGHAVHTTEAENLKTAFSQNFDDWSAGGGRQSFKHLLGRATFMTDGAEWSHSRGILRPMFAKDRIIDLDLFEKHFQKFLKLIPEDGATVDLDKLFHRYAFDVSSEFLFGESIGSLGEQTEAKAQLGHDIELTIQDAADRFRYSLLYRLLKRKGVDEAIRNVHDATNKYVQETLERAAEAEKSFTATDDKESGYSFLDEMARQTQDPKKMREEATSLMFAGKDTTAGLLGSMWFLLARNPAAWQKLVAEIDQLEGVPPSYQWIKNAKYLRYCEHEVTPILPPRISNKDTVLPVGGGEDGKSPLFVPKGAALVVNIYCANRRKDVFGDDVEDFRPERWEDLRPGWIVDLPAAEQFAITEVYYLTVRLIQHFRRIECRDPNSFVENLAGVILSSDNGVKVGLYPN
ncbi:cytochrome P450 52A1 [Aureobasidium pullulans]|nr:cytochrome P450 52A1 [Aureobasidium pullulans]